MRRERMGLWMAVALGTMLAGCSTTDFKSTWKDPSAQAVSLQGQKVAGFVLTSNESTRRAGETALARELTSRGVQGIAGYELTGGRDIQDPTALRELLRREDIEAAVIMRVVDRRQEVNYSPAVDPYYGSMYGYWGHGWSSVNDPGYLTTNTIVSVETLVYSVPQNKLLWGGVSETFDPNKIDSFIKEVVDEAADEMKKANLIRR
jgi:hypothetical protein